MNVVLRIIIGLQGGRQCTQATLTPFYSFILLLLEFIPLCFPQLPLPPTDHTICLLFIQHCVVEWHRMSLYYTFYSHHLESESFCFLLSLIQFSTSSFLSPFLLHFAYTDSHTEIDKLVHGKCLYFTPLQHRTHTKLKTRHVNFKPRHI